MGEAYDMLFRLQLLSLGRIELKEEVVTKVVWKFFGMYDLYKYVISDPKIKVRHQSLLQRQKTKTVTILIYIFLNPLFCLFTHLRIENNR